MEPLVRSLTGSSGLNVLLEPENLREGWGIVPGRENQRKRRFPIIAGSYIE